MIIQSHAAFRLLLAVPAAIITSRFLFGTGGFGFFISASGEWSARLLIATLAVTPLRMIFKGRHWPMWLFKRRRDMGVAAFLYAAAHLGAYSVHEASLAKMWQDLSNPHFPLGWLALAAMVIPFALSNQWALRRFGLWWKSLQRAVYISAVATLAHWLLAKADWLPAVLHFLPLAGLEAYRLARNLARRPLSPRAE